MLSLAASARAYGKELASKYDVRVDDGGALGSGGWQCSQHVHLLGRKKAAEMQRAALIRQWSFFKHQVHEVIAEKTRAVRGGEIFAPAYDHAARSSCATRAAPTATRKSSISMTGIVNLADPGRPFCGPARLERGTTIGEQTTFRPEPPRHRHNEHTTAV